MASVHGLWSFLDHATEVFNIYLSKSLWRCRQDAGSAKGCHQQLVDVKQQWLALPFRLYNPFFSLHLIKTKIYTESLIGELTRLLQSHNFLNCPLEIFNSILKTASPRSVMNFIVMFCKINSFLPYLLKIYFFKELIAQYLTVGSPVIAIISEMT